jgi:signal transduction histidine kinase
LLLAQLEAGRQPDPGHLRMALAAIDRQSQKLAHLVSQLLDISRLQAGSLVLERRPTDIAALLASVVDSLRSTTARHQITLRCPAGLQAHVDALRLEQVLTNLLDNAIKYSPDGGPIAVVAGSRSGRLKVTVSDRGIGVPQKHRARIFDRYYRAHDGRGFAGMGLGLYISRQIVELHGGTLVAEHPRVGGTALVLCVPAGPPAP